MRAREKTRDRVRKTRWTRGLGRALALAPLLVAPALLVGCDEPCVELEHKVCNTLKDQRRCEMIQDVERREVLSDGACASILESIDRR
jgi:hypothetical protein